MVYKLLSPKIRVLLVNKIPSLLVKKYYNIKTYIWFSKVCKLYLLLFGFYTIWNFYSTKLII